MAGPVEASKKKKKPAPEPTTAVLTIEDKPSLKKITETWGDGKIITEQFAAPFDATKFKKIAKDKGKTLDEFLDLAKQSRSFARGEIEEEIVMNGLVQMLQLSILRSRNAFQDGKLEPLREELGAWFLFAADFPYEESSHIGLKVSAVLRSLILDELERIEKTTTDADQSGGERSAKWITWVRSLRAPWPVDRVILSEGRRTLNSPLQKVASQLALQLQKNPYQTAAQVLEKLPGGQADALGFLREMWTDKDLTLLKTEVSRLHRLQLRWALKGFETRGGRPAANLEEAAKAAGIAPLPVNYLTGKIWDLAAVLEEQQ